MLPIKYYEVKINISEEEEVISKRTDNPTITLDHMFELDNQPNNTFIVMINITVIDIEGLSSNSVVTEKTISIQNLTSSKYICI